MKKIVFEFMRRGAAVCGLGPIVLAIVYLVLKSQASIDYLSVNQVCVGIFSLSVLAFLAGGMNIIYQIEKIPLMTAILIHGSVLYISYLATYLLNNWLEWSTAPIAAFSGIFILGYFIIWIIIYFTTKRKTEQINEILKEKQKNND